uniref:AlNc14C53G4133 protein n=1 Tax=Albugo laibachii Nc14 TaxID=890382 RepID=F0WBU2_9STRA|nr:AlNc14C53G4133 [Albugo laibachii Nc14]|eukprot:CCA18619.1 AlNc14C53G4133 [Albugo laibachii Nc14]
MARQRRKNEELTRLVSDMTAKLEDSAKEVLKLKATNDDLSCLLSDTTQKHLEAIECIDYANETMQHFPERLEASQLWNVGYQIKLDKAAEENEEGREAIETLIKEHQQAKANMVETGSRLEALKACMEVEDARLPCRKRPTCRSVEYACWVVSEEDRYYQTDKEMMATELVDMDNDNSKKKPAYTEDNVYSLKDSYIEEHSYSHDGSTEECTNSMDISTEIYAYSQDCSTEECIFKLDRDEGAAALQDQVHSLNEVIDSMKNK